MHTTLDPRLPAVLAANDPERMRAALDAWFARAGRAERVDKLAVQRIFYLPGQECTLVYDVVLRRGSDSEAQILFGDLCYDDDPAALVDKAVRKAAKGRFVTPRLGAPAYHLPELGMALWTFPNDPKLKSLPANLRPSTAREALSRLGGPEGEDGGDWEVGAFDQTLVRYIPRKRCVLRYEIEWRRRRGADGSPQGTPSSMLRHVYAKVYDDAEVARHAYALLEALWRASQADARSLRVPRPLGLDLDHAAVYQAAVPGTHLTRALEAVTTAQVAGIARGLALLQLGRPPLATVLTLEDELAKTRAQARLVAVIHAEADGILREIDFLLAARLPGLPRLPLVPCHGTFKLAHLLSDGTRTSLVDFDSFVLADPIYDVANFVADLHYLEAQGALPGGRAAKLARAFYEAWVAQVPWGRCDAGLDWYVACLLVRKQALKPVKHLHPDAGDKIQRVLREARERLRS